MLKDEKEKINVEEFVDKLIEASDEKKKALEMIEDETLLKIFPEVDETNMKKYTLAQGIEMINTMTKYSRHESICEKLNEMYQIKNTAYDDAFSKAIKEFGPMYAVSKIYEKYMRVKALTRVENKVADERLQDTLLDMANYCIMALIEMDGGNLDEAI